MSEARFFAVKDALRVALVMPVSFALALHAFDSRPMSLFAAFGPMALLVFVQFGGRRRNRLLAYAVLTAGGAGLIAIGTLCSRTPWLATAAMLVLGFAIIFAGVFDEYVAAAQRGAILVFVLAVMVPADPSAIGPRVAGWGLAALLSVSAVLLLWPRRAQSAIRASAGESALRLAALAEASAGGDPDALEAADQEARAGIRKARRQFVSVAQRPSGNGGRIAALARTLDHMGWLRPFAARPTGSDRLLGLGAERAEIERGVPRLLREIAARLQGAPPSAGPHPDDLRAAHRRLGETIVARFEQLPEDADEATLSADLDEAYRLRQLAFGALQLADDAGLACGDRARGESRERARARVAETGRVTRAHATIRSVWLHNSVRGAVGLAAAVLVAQVADVQNGFWVVLGTLSVLRSSALATGTTIVLGLLGTFTGIVLGGLLIALVGTDPAVLWPLLPLAVFLAAYAIRAVSFAAGQAAFSFVVLVLFNLINPIGWQVGVIRVEDVAIGAGISLLSGLLIWPRGATALMRQALASRLRRRRRLAGGDDPRPARRRRRGPPRRPARLRVGPAARHRDARLPLRAERRPRRHRGARAAGRRRHPPAPHRPPAGPRPGAGAAAPDRPHPAPGRGGPRRLPAGAPGAQLLVPLAGRLDRRRRAGAAPRGRPDPGRRRRRPGGARTRSRRGRRAARPGDRLGPPPPRTPARARAAALARRRRDRRLSVCRRLGGG